MSGPGLLWLAACLVAFGAVPAAFLALLTRLITKDNAADSTEGHR